MANLKFLRYKTTSEFNTAKTNKTFNQGDVVFDSEAKILYIVTDNTPTLEPYYGNNAIKGISQKDATLTITFLDGRPSESITIDNVASAGAATKATNDSDGNQISTTYFKKSGGIINGATTINGGLTATGETDVESLTADSLIVNGSARFNNNITADTFTGNLKGNADTATSASTAGTASKLSTSAGSTTQPVYFKDGVPVAITGNISNKATTAGTADYATKLGNSTNSYTYTDVSDQFAALNLVDTNLSNRIGDTELAIGNKLSEIENNINDIADWQQNPTADEIITNRLGVLESINIGGTILDKTEYQGNAKTASSAVSASKLTSSAGSETLPVYFTGGIPKAINTTGVGISITGSAASATKATQDANGNIITNTYATKTELANKSDITHTHLYAGSNSAGGGANTIATEVGTTNVNRPVFFAYNGDPSRVVYDNNFVYNPATTTLTIGTGTLTGTNYSGNAATATSAITAGTASKTQFALKFGENSFDGSSTKTITAADLGLSSALKFLGTTTTALTDGAKTNPITINGANVTAQTGNVVLYNHLEFLWNDSSWEELGDEESFALKSIQIKTGGGLSGGGALIGDVTISHADTSSQTSMTTGGRTYINSITLDDYGHVTALGTGTETDQSDISGNAATATTATSASGLICSDVRGEDRSPDTYFTAKRVTALFNNSISGANSVWNSAIHVHGWTSGYVAWELIGPATSSIGSDNLYWREGISSTWQSVRKILDSSNYNSYAPTLTGTGASGTWGINISGNASTSSACSGNSATASVTEKAVGTYLYISSSTLINAGFLASDYESRYDTIEFLQAFVKWAQTNYSGRSIFGTLGPNSSGYFFINCYSSGFNSSTGYPEHCTGRYYSHGGSSYIFGTSYGSWYCYNGISSANIASQSVSYATSAGTASSCSGNSATTTKLATAVNINGTSFNGTSSITTTNWGTARNISITDGTNTGAAVSVNGSAEVSLKLPTTISANFKGGTISGTTGTFSSSLSVTGDIAANSNVNVTNQTRSKTFSINGGCTLEYDSTNKCVKFVF